MDAHRVNSQVCLFPRKVELGFYRIAQLPFFNLKHDQTVNSFVSCTAQRRYGSSMRKSNTTSYPSIVRKNVEENSSGNDHHLWKRRERAGSGQKALHLVRIASNLPNEKEAVIEALDKWVAWETEFPLVAAAKALEILRKRRQWLQIIQVSKWMISKGQGMTMGTYDTLLLAFDMGGRVDEAETVWDMILESHTRSVPKRLFSRMMSLYDHHYMPDKLIQVFADMEELGVRPDEDTVRRIARAFKRLGHEDKQKKVIERYGLKCKYIHFNGERAKVRVEDV